jgi:hypothetical protein
LQIAEQWLDCPQVKATLELREKAAVAGGRDVTDRPDRRLFDN